MLVTTTDWKSAVAGRGGRLTIFVPDQYVRIAEVTYCCDLTPDMARQIGEALIEHAEKEKTGVPV